MVKNTLNVKNISDSLAVYAHTQLRSNMQSTEHLYNIVHSITYSKQAGAASGSNTNLNFDYDVRHTHTHTDFNRFSNFKPCRYRYRFSTINIKPIPIPISQEIPINTDYGR